ncbi:hypothetical protein BASA50_003501 [Batrachochytrium salamandrivorans]|uniref:Adenylyl cyclase-associated protein n=1 Tax=Batrachochytrium salamandrivorans TaxID=1357716 RepID=A0ABQ8FHL1_9FUNG|nr:hypothetical protein BASA60_011228 [Batrachochytrium salamandrivorans]KAH6571519.1 hypothetical protein BASA62_003841 [Batrachochytrium salamandrivorans]KAH6598461.1 hypothetical protein BASA50_003501 [Batrachochytrium salamandrivorans]KAH6599136.1 hypothetical protein BASA61_002667 [Batrachochytrium salamandrivorans]KAH9251635.1 hypothetical protein BASA81_010476 [Batrachochytrium salamandrivorans]
MSADSQLSAVIQRLEVAALRLETLAKTSYGANAAGAPSSVVAADTGNGPSPSLAAFDTLLEGSLKTFLTISTTLGGLVDEQAGLVHQALVAQRRLLATASVSKKPDATAIQQFISPLQQALSKVVELKDKNRPSPLFFHLSTVADGIGALGWVVVEPAPSPYVNELKEAAQFYANKVIKENKDKDKAHAEWVAAYIGFLADLSLYVKQWHTTGLAWNPRGGDAQSLSATKEPTPAKAVSSAPAPAKPAAVGMGSLFGDINKSGVTSGLRKVDASEMTHKNPELRATSVVKAKDLPAGRSATLPSTGHAASTRGPAKLALEGKKWVVENQVGQSNLVIEGVELQHVVYIYNCQDTTVQIKGKVNAVTIDGCKKFGVVLENVLSTIDVVNGKSIQVQITGKAPIVVVDKTDGFQLYLSKESSDLEIFSAKSSEMNVLIQKGDGDYGEQAIPEQFKTVFKEGVLVTAAVEHKG